MICDDGKYRNEASVGLHGFLTRDGIHPAELRRIGREQLDRYEVEYRQARVSDARLVNAHFELALEGGERLRCRKLLLATGVIDHIPEIEGIDRFYGCSVFHCPYCDGWEMRDQPLAVYGRGKNGAGLALSLKTWSDDVVLCTDGPAGLKAGEAAQLRTHRIAVREEKVARLEGAGEILEQIVFRGGASLPRRAMFLSTGQSQRCDLASRLGCAFTRNGAVQTGKLETTAVPGLYVAGDASKDVQLAVVAAAEGAKAAIAINASLQQQRDGT
ncbi:MAG: NAD(P)/FAD-dependent oxidoreductase [Acidobacteriia bacterium]|nr:NAD(P)/FAD-dependent oxidoreductase [Terriglobia bacterium]